MGFLEFLAFCLAVGIPSATIAYCHRKRIEGSSRQAQIQMREADNRHELNMRWLEMEHEARMLALPGLQLPRDGGA